MWPKLPKGTSTRQDLSFLKVSMTIRYKETALKKIFHLEEIRPSWPKPSKGTYRRQDISFEPIPGLYDHPLQR